MPPVTYLPEALDDIDAAYAAYEARSAGLGERFLESVRRAVSSVEANPLLRGEVARGIRACPTKRFQFVVYYQAGPTAVVVIAVRHGRDDPSVWQERA